MPKEEERKTIDDLPDTRERIEAALSFIRIAENFSTRRPDIKTIMMGQAATLGMLVNIYGVLSQQKAGE